SLLSNPCGRHAALSVFCKCAVAKARTSSGRKRISFGPRRICGSLPSFRQRSTVVIFTPHHVATSSVLRSFSPSRSCSVVMPCSLPRSKHPLISGQTTDYIAASFYLQKNFFAVATLVRE